MEIYFKRINAQPFVLLIIALVLVPLTGCEDFITKAPVDQTSVENSYESVDDANRAVLGIYDRLDGVYAQDMARLTELTTDNAYTQQDVLKGAGAGNLREIDEFRLTNENNFMETRWNHLYNGISRANLFLQKIEGIEFTDNSLKNQYIGESKFLRALFYFDLVRFFGGVPVTLTEVTSIEEAYSLGRESEDYVYSEVIIKDLEEAIDYLPVSYETENIGRATEGAAKALLAKVYLTIKSSDLALPLLRDFTNGTYNYRLMDEFGQVFDGDNTVESIFEIQFTDSEVGEGNPYPNWFLPTDASAGEDVFGDNFLGGTGGTGSVLPSTDLFDSYSEGDPRKEYTFTEYFSSVEGDTILRVNKYRGAPTSQHNSEDNLIVLRHADILLMLAEAINEINSGPTAEAYDAVDKVRMRSGLDTWTRTMSYENFKMELLEERRRELAFENHRWFDLKRFGKAVELLSAKGYNIDSHNLLFPLPRIEVELNPNIDQNPGY